MKPKFESLFIAMRLEITPEANPELGTKEVLSTRRGISCGRRTPPPTFDALVEAMNHEVWTGLRAMKHQLAAHGYIEADYPLPREEYLKRIAEELQAEGYTVTKEGIE